MQEVFGNASNDGDTPFKSRPGHGFWALGIVALGVLFPALVGALSTLPVDVRAALAAAFLVVSSQMAFWIVGSVAAATGWFIGSKVGRWREPRFITRTRCPATGGGS